MTNQPNPGLEIVVAVAPRRRPVVSTFGAAFAAFTAYLVGALVVQNQALMYETAVAALQSFKEGSFAYGITFGLIFVGAVSLAGTAVMLGWMCKTAAESAYNATESTSRSFRGQRDAALLLGATSFVFMMIVVVMGYYNAQSVRSGFVVASMLGQVNNMPKREDRQLLDDLQTGKWYSTEHDTDVMGHFKAMYRLLNWNGRETAEKFLSISLNRRWDIPHERVFRTSLVRLSDGRLRYAATSVSSKGDLGH